MRSNHAEAADLVKQLTRAEKVAMMSGGLEFWSGMVALGKHDYYHKNPFPGGACPRAGVPGILFSDGPRGVVLEGGATTFPVTMARGASWNPALEEQIGDVIGQELRALGATLYGGVCVNLLRHPAWGRAQETYGEDPVHLGTMGAALTRGVERHAMACVKHFALNSMENARFKVDVSISDRALHELYLPHFKACIDHGATVVMSAYNSVNGEWAGQNKELLTGILRERWGFEGFVLTDFIFGARDGLKAIKAGLDLEMPFPIVWGEKLTRLLDTGAVEEAELDAALIRVISPQLVLPAQEDYPRTLVGAAEHKALAREAAVQSITLLKNEGGCLPLSTGSTVAVLGPLAKKANLGDRGSSDGRPDYVVTPLEGLTHAFGPKVQYATAQDEDLIGSADAVIVVVGYTYRDEGEFIAPAGMGRFIKMVPAPRPFKSRMLNSVTRLAWQVIPPWLIDMVSASQMPKEDSGGAGNAEGPSFGRGGDRVGLGLAPADVALIEQACALNNRVIVAIMGGSAVMMEEWKDKPAAILMLWYPGMEGGHALADIVTGARCPSGKLPFAIPADDAHLPYFDKDATQITYDLWHGYRKLDRDGVKAAFPFGFGLSYTRFAYSNFTTDTAHASPTGTFTFSVDVTNTGAVAGDEIVQLYVSAPGNQVERADKELKAFARTSLAPGETRTVSLPVPVEKLGFFDEAQDGFAVEPGSYRVRAAAHADDPDALCLEVTVG